MERMSNYFIIDVSPDRMSANIHCTEEFKEQKQELSEDAIIAFLAENKIIHGIDSTKVEKMASEIHADRFPITIARGTPVEHGTNGVIHYMLDFDSRIPKTAKWNFREVMRIPSVKKGQKLATATMPTDGRNGTDVFGKTIPAHPGKPARMKAGKNVVYREDDHSYYAAREGQVSVGTDIIHVYTVFEVNEDLSLKKGNLDFVGSIVIHGDVPAGFTVKARGDIKIFGIVEAATIIAGGSIYIAEGFAGMQKGFIKAEQDVHAGYINLGFVHAGNDIYAENSILHSECIAKNNLYCRRGNIIGGAISAGRSVEAKNIGNRLGTKTDIVFGINKTISEKENKLIAKKDELLDNLKKLSIIGKKLEQDKDHQNAKLRITLLRQKNSYQKTYDKLQETVEMLEEINSRLGSEKEAYLIAEGKVYPNVIVAFGKYKRKMSRMRQHIKIRLEQNEIVINDI